MTKRERTVLVKARARALGFSHVGIAKAESLKEEEAHLIEWLAHGHHATMAWLARSPERRTDPRHILADAMSVISVAMNYYSPAQHSVDRRLGKISRYAWGDDYHDVMSNRITALQKTVEQLSPSSHNRWYVDTGPVMDKTWAVRAGIGWMGKHTNVITRDIGSWIFLGEILSTEEFEYDDPISDFCGDCTACIDACPTDAIPQAYVVDSERCISYQTIESKSETIPEELGKQFGQWIFGCDICQDVCPWNSFAKETTERTFHPRPENLTPLLRDFETMPQEEFSRRFTNSPVKRAKLSGMKRNARNVLRSASSHTKENEQQ